MKCNLTWLGSKLQSAHYSMFCNTRIQTQEKEKNHTLYVVLWNKSAEQINITNRKIVKLLRRETQ